MRYNLFAGGEESERLVIDIQCTPHRDVTDHTFQSQPFATYTLRAFANFGTYLALALKLDALVAVQDGLCSRALILVHERLINATCATLRRMPSYTHRIALCTSRRVTCVTSL